MLLLSILFILAILLALVEVYLIPGFGISGIASAGCAVAALVLTYMEYGLGLTTFAALVALVLFFLFIWWLSKSIAKSKVALQAQIDSVATAEEQLAVRVGESGVALTRLALVGRAKVGEYQVEVRSEEGFLDEGTPIVISRTAEGVIFVKRKD